MDVATTTTKVLIIDDNSVVRMGLSSMLGAADDVVVVGEAANGSDGIALLSDCEPDVVLCDIRMPVMDGIETLRNIAGHCAVLMLTSTEDPDTIRTALGLGAKGYIVYGERSPEEMVAAVRAAAQGSTVLDQIATNALLGSAGQSQSPGLGLRDRLTARECEIMDRIAEGLGNRDIARTCFVAEKTVKNHVNSILSKLHVTTRSEAIALWLRESQA